MGDVSIYLGTQMGNDPDMYDCCAENYTTVPDDKKWDAYLFWHDKIGWFTFGQAAKLFNWKKFCQFNPSEAQPNHGCTYRTWFNADLACTLEQHGSASNDSAQSSPI